MARPRTNEQKPRSLAKRKRTKSILVLPDLEHEKAAVLNTLQSSEAQRGYRHAIAEFVAWVPTAPGVQPIAVPLH